LLTIIRRNILRNEFLEMPMEFVDSCLKLNGYRLYSAYRILEEAHRTLDKKPTFKRLQKARKAVKQYNVDNIEIYIKGAFTDKEREIYEELKASWRLRDTAEAKRRAEAELEILEQENVRKAEAEGTMSECSCCFCEFPLNRMVHCDSADVLHWFCRRCARMSAETEIGNSKYELICMSMDGCEAGFSMDQR
jgi:TRIAD3 protein (E3 ubiquitin-protein ligase RNF216)